MYKHVDDAIMHQSFVSYTHPNRQWRFEGEIVRKICLICTLKLDHTLWNLEQVYVVPISALSGDFYSDLHEWYLVASLPVPPGDFVLVLFLQMWTS